MAQAYLSAEEVAEAIAEERCNGCRQPRRYWGPVCGGMTQGDWTHYHSPEWWQARAERLSVEPDGDYSAGTPDHNRRID